MSEPLKDENRPTREECEAIVNGNSGVMPDNYFPVLRKLARYCLALLDENANLKEVSDEHIKKLRVELRAGLSDVENRCYPTDIEKLLFIKYCLFRERKQLRHSKEVLQKLLAALKGVLRYRDHATHCEINQTDFCNCGLMQIANEARAAIALAENLEKENKNERTSDPTPNPIRNES